MEQSVGRCEKSLGLGFHIRLVRAAPRETVLPMVRRFLMTLGQEESESERLKRLQTEVLSTVRRFRAGDRLTRDRVHERNAFR